MSQSTALLLTVLLEMLASGVWWTAHRMSASVGRPPLGRLLLATLTVSLLTHPFAWWANHAFVGEVSRWTRVGLIEAAVVLAEGALFVFLIPLGARRAFPLALLTNATSFGVGLIILALIRG